MADEPNQAKKNQTMTPNHPSQTAQKPNPYASISLIKAEIVDARNRTVIWGPTKDNLRSRWVRMNLRPAESGSEEMGIIPDIPGMAIVIDCPNRKVGIIDLLNEPNQKENLERIQHAIKRSFNQDQGPAKDKYYENVDDTQLKTWLYYLYRLLVGSPKVEDNNHLVDGGPNAILLQGKIPEDLESLPGLTEMSLFDHHSGRVKSREQYQAIRRKREEEWLT